MPARRGDPSRPLTVIVWVTREPDGAIFSGGTGPYREYVLATMTSLPFVSPSTAHELQLDTEPSANIRPTASPPRVVESAEVVAESTRQVNVTRSGSDPCGALVATDPIAQAWEYSLISVTSGLLTEDDTTCVPLPSAVAVAVHSAPSWQVSKVDWDGVNGVEADVFGAAPAGAATQMISSAAPRA